MVKKYSQKEKKRRKTLREVEKGHVHEEEELKQKESDIAGGR